MTRWEGFVILLSCWDLLQLRQRMLLHSCPNNTVEEIKLLIYNKSELILTSLLGKTPAVLTPKPILPHLRSHAYVWLSLIVNISTLQERKLTAECNGGCQGNFLLLTVTWSLQYGYNNEWVMKHMEIIPSKDAVTSETATAQMMSLEPWAALIVFLLHNVTILHIVTLRGALVWLEISLCIFVTHHLVKRTIKGSTAKIDFFFFKTDRPYLCFN